MTKELRIGNLLLHEGEVKEVNEIGTKEVNEGVCGYVGFKSSKTMSWLEHKGSWLVNPIPLTEEWLVKFGFNKPVDTFYLNGFAVWQTLCGNEDGSDCIGFFYELRDRGIMDKHIKHVHQLQNLYFALTGEEITIKKLK